jgi:hypothetical protein
MEKQRLQHGAAECHSWLGMEKDFPAELSGATRIMGALLSCCFMSIDRCLRLISIDSTMYISSLVVTNPRIPYAVKTDDQHHGSKLRALSE